jgi:ATP-dependent helicase/nuclease subunit B
LERIASRTMFAPESREAPVQVLGPLEAAGCGFDAVWFLQAGDLSWPAGVSVNPLLPWQMQQALGMPGAEPAKDRDYARRITQRIAESAGSVVFSYAKEAAEGRQRASTVVDELRLERVESSALMAVEPQRALVETESVVDDARLPLLPDEGVRGGAKILALQAACGFRAFSEQRLGAAEFRESELGMDAVERGNVVHKVLENFWREVKTQDVLKTMSASERSEALVWAIREGLQKQKQMSTSAWDVAYIYMQQERLHYLLEHWLELEMERPPFAVKLQEDMLQNAQVGPLRLSVRVDRVDESEDGEIIIDYKTGAAHPNDWLSERPDAPQLPLYAILSQAERLAGVAFALVRAGKDRGLRGFATSEEVGIKMPKKNALPLEAQVEDWRQVLTKLAEDFYHGDVRVRPKNYPKTCEHCGQRLICRLDAAMLEEVEDDSATEVERG